MGDDTTNTEKLHLAIAAMRTVKTELDGIAELGDSANFHLTPERVCMIAKELSFTLGWALEQVSVEDEKGQDNG